MAFTAGDVEMFPIELEFGPSVIKMRVAPTLAAVTRFAAVDGHPAVGVAKVRIAMAIAAILMLNSIFHKSRIGYVKRLMAGNAGCREMPASQRKTPLLMLF